MPRRPGRPCAWRGCTALVHGKDRYCTTHLAQVRKEQDGERGSSTARGYGAKWRAIRDEFLKYHPYCARCGARATTVHHRSRKRAGGSDDDGNLEPLCTRCHNSETMQNDVPRDGGGASKSLDRTF